MIKEIDVRELSKNDFRKLLDEISTCEIFQTCDTAKLEEIAKNSKVKFASPYDAIWDSEEDLPLDFSLIVGGCVAVVYEKDVKVQINSLLFPGQFFGEFELFGFRSQSYKLQSLTDVKILVPTPEDTQNLRKTASGKFYRSLARSIIIKVKHQNNFTAFRSRKNVTERIAYLLNRFKLDKEWNQLITKLDQNRNSYEINVFWSTSALESLLYSEHISICKNLAEMIRQDVIAVNLYDKNFEFEKALDEATLLKMAPTKRKQVSDDNYIKIQVLDSKNMKLKNRVKNY